jgi:hypothetical protein
MAILLPAALRDFLSKWRMRFSHFRGGSYNHTVVQILIVMPASAL